MRVRDQRLELRRGKPDRLPYFDVRGFPRLNGSQFINADGWIMAIPPNTDRRDFEAEIAAILEDARSAQKFSAHRVSKRAPETVVAEEEDHAEQPD